MANKRFLIAKTKNLFDIDNPKYGATHTANATSYPRIKNGVIYFNTWYSVRGGLGFAVPIEPNTTFTISFDIVVGEFYTEIIYCESIGEDKVCVNFGRFASRLNQNKLTYTQPNNANYVVILLDCVGGYYKCGIRNLQIELGSTATEYQPYGYLPSYKKLIKVSEYCQLLDKSKYPATQTIYGVTFTNNGDGSITLNGTATARRRSFLLCSAPTIKGHTYLLSGCPEGGAYANFVLETSWGNDYGSGNIMTFTRDVTSGKCYITIGANFVFSKLVFKPQLFDLTEMYGAGNEPTTVEEFRTKFPNELYDYKPYSWLKAYKKNLIVGGGQSV